MIEAANSIVELTAGEVVTRQGLVLVGFVAVGQLLLTGAEVKHLGDLAELGLTADLEALDGDSAMECELTLKVSFEASHVQNVLAERTVADASLELLEQLEVVVHTGSVDEPGDAELTGTISELEESLVISADVRVALTVGEEDQARGDLVVRLRCKSQAYAAGDLCTVTRLHGSEPAQHRVDSRRGHAVQGDIHSTLVVEAAEHGLIDGA